MAPGKCLYELLDITKDADEEAIKKAYRRQALVWHPDKNSHRPDEAAERFKEVQNAYEVLSDPHERAWYDSHRDQIIKSGERHQAGGTGFEGGARPDDEEDMFPYFSANCFSGYGDGPKGFYGVYSALFEKLTRQEMEAFDDRDDDEEASGTKDCPTFPRFGSSHSDAVEVNAFYAFWSHLSTFKQFSWADLYNPAAAPSRHVRRRMEEENRKARRAKRREYNDTVRELAAFIKKRDKRVAKFQAEEAAKRAARQAEDDERRRAEREARLAAAAQYEEADWIKASDAARRPDEDHSADEEEEQQGFYCMACDKSFRSEKQLHNHERSKKHQEQLAELKALLEAEEGLDAAALHEALGSREVQSSRQDMEDKGRRKGKKKSKKKGRQMPTPGDESEEVADEAVEEEAAEVPAPSAPAPGPAADSAQEDKAATEPEESEGSEVEDEDEALARMLQSKATVKGGPSAARKDPGEEAQAETSEEEQGEDDEEQQPEQQQALQQEEEEEEEPEDEDVLLARLLSGRKPAAGGRSSSAPGKDKPGPLGAASAASATPLQPAAAAFVGDDEGSDGEVRRSGKGSKKGATRGKGQGSKESERAGAQASGPRPPASAQQQLPVETAAAGSDSATDDEAEKLSKKAKRKAKASAASKAGTDDKSCKKCGEKFQSRSQLFKHLESSGHAAMRS